MRSLSPVKPANRQISLKVSRDNKRSRLIQNRVVTLLSLHSRVWTPPNGFFGFYLANRLVFSQSVLVPYVSVSAVTNLSPRPESSLWRRESSSSVLLHVVFRTENDSCLHCGSGIGLLAERLSFRFWLPYRFGQVRLMHVVLLSTNVARSWLSRFLLGFPLLIFVLRLHYVTLSAAMVKLTSSILLMTCLMLVPTV